MKQSIKSISNNQPLKGVGQQAGPSPAQISTTEGLESILDGAQSYLEALEEKLAFTAYRVAGIEESPKLPEGSSLISRALNIRSRISQLRDSAEQINQNL